MADEKQIEVKGFFIEAAGDPSVGIHSASWSMEGIFYFEDATDLEHFKGKIKAAFDEYIDDNCEVTTFEEIKGVQ